MRKQDRRKKVFLCGGRIYYCKYYQPDSWNGYISGLCNYPFAVHDASNMRRCPMYSELGSMSGYHPVNCFVPKGGSNANER